MYRKALYELQLRRSIKSSYWLQRLKYYGLTDLSVSVSDNDDLFIDSLEIELCANAHAFVLQGYVYTKELKEIGARFFINDDKNVGVKIADLTFIVHSKQELFILNEIFCKNCYNYMFRSNSIVIDIGFNVGFASLFFAQNNLVDHVYGFEPFGSTYVLGQKNIEMNQALIEKISVFNYGLSTEDKCFAAKFNEEKRGNNIAAPVAVKSGEGSENIVLKDVSNAFREIQMCHTDKNLVVKMDCEGGEYEMIEKLDADGLLSNIEVLMIEWHKRGPDPIAKALINNGFSVFSVRDSMELGFLYAAKRSK